MRRRISVFSVIALISATLGVVTAAPVAAGTSISYSGRGSAFSGTVAGTNAGFADTLALPSTGGNQSAALISVGVSSLLGADTLHASTIGKHDRTRTEASAARVSITVGNDSIRADFAMSRTMAVSDHGAPVLSGRSEVSNLIVNDVAVTVTGQVNQIVPLPDGQLIVNERITSSSGATGSITVNALHLTVPGGTDLLVASSSAGVTAGSSNCASGTQPTSGGGWIFAPGGGKGTFGITGRITSDGGFFGHVVYTDHDTNTKIRGPVTFYEQVGDNAVLRGPAEVNGQPAGDFQVDVQDNGEPGDGDSFAILTTGPQPEAAGGLLQGGNIQVHRVCR